MSDSDPSTRTVRFSRRQLLQVGATATVAAGVTAAGLALAEDDHAAPRVLARVRDHRLARASGAPAMVIVRGLTPAERARRAIEALGGMAAFVRPGDKVLIKPNVGWNRTPAQAADTDPEVVGQIVRMVKAAGAAKVWVTDVPVNDADRSFERSGIRRAVGEAGGEVILPTAGGFREVEIGGKLLRTGELLWPFVEADRIINVPVVKQHGSSKATCCMKNWIGVLGGARARLHQDIHGAIVDLARLMKPTLTVVDASRVLLANGPSGGSLDDVKAFDTLAAGIDEVALDSFAVTLLGLKAAEVPFIVAGEKAGLGRTDYAQLHPLEITG